MVDVAVERVMPDGQRQQLPTPAAFQHFEWGYTQVEHVPQRVERAIGRHMRDMSEDDPPGTRYEWTVNYAHNSMTLDRQHVVVREVPHAR